MNKKLAARIKSLPQKPGAYLFQDAGGHFLYIGKAINLRNRVKSHFVKNSGAFKGDLMKNVADIDFIITTDAKEALILENELIKKYKPRYNIQWRDDKSYFWVNFTADEWPRVRIVHKNTLIRHPEHSEGSPANAGRHKVGDSSAYGLGITNTPIGPFTNGTELKQVLRALRKILPYRTCKNPYDKPCLQWHLGLCPAHGGVSRSANRQSSIDPPQPSFLKEGGAVFFQKTARVDLKIYRQSLNTYHLSLNVLSQLLRLYANEPLRVEAYDISNIQGANATGSMVVFKGFERDRSQYRKFRIKTVRGANDIAMLKEVLRRRLNHAEWPLPDLILIDGGRAQLNAANLAYSKWQIANGKLNSALPYAISYSPLAIIALAKKEEELYTIYSNKVLRLGALPTDLRLLFQAIRDEAHRFAIFYYRKLHRRKMTAN